MVVCLAEHSDFSEVDFVPPASGKVTISCQQEPSILAADSNNFGIFDILSLGEVIIVNHQAKTDCYKSLW